MNVEQKARAFALEAHKDQRYGELSYEFHLRAVVAAVGPNVEPEVRAAAWLHDVVEDTKTTMHDIRQEFGGKVARIVDTCTDGDGDTRKERKAEVYKKLSVAPWPARRVKIADRLANMQASIENPKMAAKYLAEFPDFIRACGDDVENYDLIVKIFWIYMDSVEAGSK